MKHNVKPSPRPEPLPHGRAAIAELFTLRDFLKAPHHSKRIALRLAHGAAQIRFDSILRTLTKKERANFLDGYTEDPRR